MTMNISWAFAGNAVYAACQWVVFVLLLRALPLADAGQFVYWIAVTGPIFMLANVRLRNLVATDVERTRAFADYLRARLLTTALAVAMALPVALSLPGGRDAIAIVALVVLAKSCDAISDICHGLFQRELDMRSAAIGLLANGILSVVFVAASLAAWPSLTLAAGAYAAGSAVTLAGWDLPRMRRLAGAHPAAPAPIAAVPFLIWRALPLGLSSAVGSLQVNLPRYIVAAFLGHAALAVFTALAYIPTLGNLVVNAVAQASLPVLARDLRASGATYRRRLRGLVQSGVALGATSLFGTLVIGRPVLSAIYGADVAERFDVLLWLMIAAALSYSFVFLGTAATARLRFRAQLLLSLAGLVTVAVSIVPLVSRFGLAGAGIALCAAALVEGGGYVALTLHDLRPGARPHAAIEGLLAGAGSR